MGKLCESMTKQIAEGPESYCPYSLLCNELPERGIDQESILIGSEMGPCRHDRLNITALRRMKGNQGQTQREFRYQVLVSLNTFG